MATLTHSGRTAIAASLKQQPLFFAWGTGDPEWGDNAPPAENIQAKELINEVGRRKIRQVHFVKPDDDGDIVLTQQIDDNNIKEEKYTLSDEPTRYLLFRVNFDFTDAPTSSIREIGVFVGGTVQENLPAGQFYFTPDQVTNKGHLLSLENIKVIHRSNSTRESFDLLLTL